jgi:methyl-accepting chemotaxis protein
MKIKIRTKLLLAFAIILLLSSAVNIYGLFQMGVLADLTTQIYNHPLQVTRAVLTADSGIVKIHRSMKDVVLADNVTQMEVAQAAVNQYEEEVYEQFAIVQKWILGEEGAQLIANTIKIFQDWAPIREEVIALMKANKKAEAVAITRGKGAKQVALLNSKMTELALTPISLS